MAKQYNFGNIRALFSGGFNDEELRRLCYDMPDFRPVYDQLARNTGKAEIIDRLIEHADRKLQLEVLLAWVKEHNPARYTEHQPFYNDIPIASVSQEISRQATQSAMPHSSIGIYIRNKDLGIQRFLSVASHITGWQLSAQVRTAMELKDSVSDVGGLVGLRFQYALLYNNLLLPEQSPLVEMGVTDGSILDLVVKVEQFTPSRNSVSVEYRPAETPTGLSSQMKRHLLLEAFGHLMTK